MEFELQPSGMLRYANNSNYKDESMIRKKVYVSDCVMNEIEQIVEESGILEQDDALWPEPDRREGMQELEIVCGRHHISFNCTKLDSSLDIQKSRDPEGLQIYYYLIQDLKSLIFSLINTHFKNRPL